MKLETWKAACKPLNNESDPITIEILAFDHMDVFNKLFSRKDVGQMFFTSRKVHFEKNYTDEKKKEYMNSYTNQL